jgi:hypothetical protein
MSEFTLYGLNEAGKAAHSEVLRAVDRAALPGLARERLSRWAAVEIWEGPICLVRLGRAGGADG